MTAGATVAAVVEPILDPVKLLTECATRQATGYLKVTGGDVNWFIYFDRGKLFYANHSVEPFERFESHLRRHCQGGASLNDELYNDLRQRFGATKLEDFYPSFDYQAVQWLLDNKGLAREIATQVIRGISKEAICAYLLLNRGRVTFVKQDNTFEAIWSGNFLYVLKECQEELASWQGLGPSISSPYQSPYLLADSSNLAPELRDKLAKILIGFNFRQLAVLLKQEELAVARNLQRLIASNCVGLREPAAPFDRLPRTYRVPENKAAAPTPPKAIEPPKAQTAAASKVYKIACVDDSPTILREINRFLSSESFQVFPIVDSATALMKIVRINPEIVLLDVGMPNIDGYKLCSMLRKHPNFKNTPIVMVTGNTGIIDRAKAKMAGCTDYMTKPFTQAGLVEMVSKYILTDRDIE
jgi:two-component system, chemotaxis family, response regulator PixG